METNSEKRLLLQIDERGMGTGIGPERARAMLDRFGRLKKVFNADVETLQEVKGIGKKKAHEVFAAVNGKSKK